MVRGADELMEGLEANFRNATLLVVVAVEPFPHMFSFVLFRAHGL